MDDFDQLFPIDKQNLHNRKWNSKDQFKKGKFTPEELEIIKRALIEYATKNNLNEDNFLKLITESYKKEYPKAWIEIAKALPDRSVLSIYNQVKQKFHPENYQGAWTHEEEQQLLALVQQHGRKFKEISQVLKRTPLNIRDKLRSLGDHNYIHRDSSWKMGELVHFLRLINRNKQSNIIKPDWEETLIANFGEEWAELALKSVYSTQMNNRDRRYKKEQPDEDTLSKVLQIIDHQEFEKMNKSDIPWVNIANKLKTKSKDDLRNLWNQQITYWMVLSKQTIDEEQFIRDLILQDPVDEEDINFNLILRNSKVNQQEKLEFWEQLKKRVQVRDNMDINYVISLLYQQITQRTKKTTPTKQQIKQEKAKTKMTPLDDLLISFKNAQHKQE